MTGTGGEPGPRGTCKCTVEWGEVGVGTRGTKFRRIEKCQQRRPNDCTVMSRSGKQTVKARRLGQIPFYDEI